MSSNRRIQASRANGARSTGPKTPESRWISSQNSLKHGLRSTALVLDAEESSAFDALMSDFFAELQPVGELEAGLVQSMAAAWWRMLRSWTIEKRLWDANIAQQDPDADPAVQAAAAFHSMTEGNSTLGNIARYETSNERRYHRALQELRLLQEERRRLGIPTAGLGLTASISGTFRKKVILPDEPSPKIGHPAADQPATPAGN